MSKVIRAELPRRTDAYERAGVKICQERFRIVDGDQYRECPAIRFEQVFVDIDASSGGSSEEGSSEDRESSGGGETGEEDDEEGTSADQDENTSGSDEGGDDEIEGSREGAAE